MPSKVSFKGNWDVTNDTANDVVNIGHDNGGQFQFVTDGVVQELNGGVGVSFKFDTNARTAKFVNADGTDALVVNDGGPIEMLHNGAVLDPTSSGLTDGGSINSTTQTFRGYYDSDGTTSITASGVDASFQHVANADGSSSLDAIVQGATVLSLNDNAVVEINDDIKSNKDLWAFRTSGTGSGRFAVYDWANSQDKFVVNEGGSVEVKNSNLSLGGNNIKFTDTKIWFNGTMDIDTAGGMWNFRDSSNTPIFRVNDGGPVEVLNADLEISGTTNPKVSLGTGSAGVYEASGEVKAVDDAGNTTTLT